MARPLRIEYAGAFYHVIHRGNAGERIFRTKRDREKFLDNVAAVSRNRRLKGRINGIKKRIINMCPLGS